MRSAVSTWRSSGRSGQQRVDVLLAKDGRLERPGVPARLEPELVVQPHPEFAVAAERLVRAVEGVEREHLGAVGALAEAIERSCCLGMSKRGSEVELGQGGVGGVEAGSEHTALVAAADVEGPGGVGLVFEDLAADETERLLERRARPVGRLAARAFEQLVEAVEVERDELGREPVRLVLGDDQPAGTLAVGREVPPQCRYERLERAGNVLRSLAAPDELRKAVDGCRVTPSDEEDLEHLLRPDAAEVARADRAAAVFDRKRAEETDHRPVEASLKRAGGDRGARGTDAHAPFSRPARGFVTRGAPPSRG